MGISLEFHNALIKSIVDISKRRGINIFRIIKLVISETNWTLSQGERGFGDKPISKYVQKHIDGEYSYPLVSQHPGTRREVHLNLYRDCLIRIHEYLNGDWEVSWFDFLTYLLFIQSNCHHKGGINSHKLCRNSDSFLDFFYKSKSGFDPWYFTADFGNNVILETKKAELRGDWWVKTFELELNSFLMFDSLAPTRGLKGRNTTGWIVIGMNGIGSDFLPHGSVINQLRMYYGLPTLSGEYGLGVMAAGSNVLYDLDKDDTLLLDEDDKDKGLNDGVDKNTGINDDKCVYFNMGVCFGIGIVCIFRVLKSM